MRLIRPALLPRLLLTAGLAAFSGSAYAESPDILNSIGDAVRTLNYQGVMVYAHEGQMHSLRIVHRYRNGREQERLQALTGEPREVLRDNEVVTCILPQEQKVLVDRHDMRGPLSTVASLSAESLSPHYKIKQEPDQRLVDRNCKVLSLQPVDHYRYGYRIWVDEQTELPLRIDLLGTGGQTLEQVMFTQISYPEEIADIALQPAVDPAEFAWVRPHSQSSMRVNGDAHWQIQDLPPGFQLVSHEVRQGADSELPMESFLFSDGLATVSAILKPLGNKPPNLLGLSQIGALHAYSQQSGDYHLAVTGEVPATTVRHIAENLHRKPQVTTAENPAAPTE